MTAVVARRWQPMATAGLAVIGVAAFGVWITDLGPWYFALQKPRWQPPDWLFGPVWTTIFLLAGSSAVIAWTQACNTRQRRLVVVLFIVNVVLNMLWSTLFFRLHRPDLALVEVIALWLSVLSLFYYLWPVAATASWLVLPYLAWVTFAANLNLAIVRLNGPFA